MFNVVVPTFNRVSGITLSSYGYTEPLHELNKLKRVVDYSNFCSNPSFYNNEKSILTNLPPWHNDIHKKNNNLISCYVTESNQLIPEQQDFLTNCKEIWVPTNFCKEVLLKSDIPCEVIPYSISAPRRERLKEDKDKFTFLISFDGKFSFIKKGVAEAIEAFKLAFDFKENVFLKIKTFNLNLRTKIILSNLIRNDSRIKIFDEELLDFEELYDNVSCYLSLHKGEGFGRHIAESMLRDLLVVVTNYSGPTDFCNNENSLLVNEGDLVQHKQQCKYYSFEGEWFQPKIISCAEAMRKAYELNFVEAQNLITRARKTIIEKYSNRAISNLLKQKI